MAVDCKEILTIKPTRFEGPVRRLARWMREDIHRFVWRRLRKPISLLFCVFVAGAGYLMIVVGLKMLQVAGR